MLHKLLHEPNLIFYILAVEVLLLCLLQLRTNGLLRKYYKMRAQKKEKVQQMKEEVKKGKSEVPVVKFERGLGEAAKEKRTEIKNGYDEKEMAVLQDMMSEFFG